MDGARSTPRVTMRTTNTVEAFSLSIGQDDVMETTPGRVNPHGPPHFVCNGTGR